jgi:SAM-dependent methyltransferase
MPDAASTTTKEPLGRRLYESAKRCAARVFRPAMEPLNDRLAKIEAHLGQAEHDARKYEGELAYWRRLVKRGGAEKDFGEPFEVVFARWQRHRLLRLGEYLGLPGVDAQGVAGIDEWARDKSVIEIGAGPYPGVAATKFGWKRCVAVDPIARGYVEEGLLPPACDAVVYIEAPGEKIPLPGEFADLVIIENCLDHVTDPPAVVAEMFRLLRPGGLLWLFVDFSDHTDALHPHALNLEKVHALLGTAGGFALVGEEHPPNKAHPKAYGAYRALWRKPGADDDGTTREYMSVRAVQPAGVPLRVVVRGEAGAGTLNGTH